MLKRIVKNKLIARIEDRTMIILIIGIAILLLLSIYFFVCDIKASVFCKLGFVNDEIPIGRVKMNKHFSFNCVGEKSNEKG